MIIAIDDREFDRGITQGMSCLQSAKSCSNYHHVWHFRWGFTLLSFNFMLCAHMLSLAHDVTFSETFLFYTSSVIAYISHACIATNSDGLPDLDRPVTAGGS